jgi:hypothetical protein
MMSGRLLLFRYQCRENDLQPDDRHCLNPKNPDRPVSTVRCGSLTEVANKRKSYCGPISVRASDARAQAASASFRKSRSACV